MLLLHPVGIARHLQQVERVILVDRRQFEHALLQEFPSLSRFQRLLSVVGEAGIQRPLVIGLLNAEVLRGLDLGDEGKHIRCIASPHPSEERLPPHQIALR